MADFLPTSSGIYQHHWSELIIPFSLKHLCRFPGHYVHLSYLGTQKCPLTGGEDTQHAGLRPLLSSVPIYCLGFLS